VFKSITTPCFAEDGVSRENKMKNQKILVIAKASVLLGAVYGAGFISAHAIPLSQAQIQKTSDKILISQILDEEYNLKFESPGCTRTGATKVTCNVVVTNVGNTRQQITVSGHTNNQGIITNAIDASGTIYPTTLAKSGANTSSNRGSTYFQVSCPPSIPTKITFDFDIPKEVNKLSAIDVGYGTKIFEKRIAIPNINIASNSTSVDNSNCNCPPKSTSAPRKR
jgi:hypothetical protein